MMPIKAAHSYDRRAPNLLNVVSNDRNKLANFFKIISQQEAHCPIEGVFLLKSCFIFEGKFVLSSNREWVESTIADFGLADHFRSVIRDIIDAGEVGAMESHEHPSFMIAKSGSGNYGHVIAEMLPKLLNIKKLGVNNIRLILPPDMDSFYSLIDQLCKYLGILAGIRTMRSGELLYATNVHIMSPVSQHDTRKSETFLEMRDALLTLYGAKSERKRSIYVRRGVNDIRKIINSEQTEEAFVKHGFEPIYPGSISIPDQIRLFAAAGRVAGSLGAGLSNIAFAPKECDVLMIDPGLGDYFFWDFTCLLQQNFTWLFSGRYQGYDISLAQEDFAIDNDLLKANLKSVY